jgi:tetratricopeptide (TPR) repeat protein
MVSEIWVDPDVQNQQVYEDLLVAVEASAGTLSLFIAVCDNDELRNQTILRYENELQPAIRPYRLTLARGEPSLRLAISQLVHSDEYLSQGGEAVLTVTGTEQLSFLHLGKERSEQEIFFGYLQWTREGLREFPYPIILWVTNQLLANLSKKAPDFWSWRKDVFRFTSKQTSSVARSEIPFIFSALEKFELLDQEKEDGELLPLEDLKTLIQKIEEQRPEDPLLGTLYDQMGKIYGGRAERGESSDYQSEIAQAIEYFHKAANLYKTFGDEADLASSLSDLASLYKSQGQYEKAEPLYEQALEMGKRLLGEEHPDVATSLNNLAGLYRNQGRYEQAEPMYKRALAIQEKVLSPEHPNVATSLNNLAELYRDLGRYEQAEPLHKRALVIWEKVLGPEHPNVATSLNNLAGLYDRQGRYEQAELMYQRALAIQEKVLGPEHPDVATSLNNLAGLYRNQSRYEQAEPLYERALAIREKVLGLEHPYVAQSLSNLAGLYRNQGRYKRAEPLHKRALAIQEKVLGPEHPDVATSINNLAGLYFSQGRYELAEPLQKRALAIQEKVLGSEHPYVATSLDNLAILYEAQNKYDKVEPLYIQALEILVNRLGSNHPSTVIARQNHIAFLAKVVQEHPVVLEHLLSAGSLMTQQLLRQMMKESRSNSTIGSTLSKGTKPKGFKPRQ